MVGKLCLSPVLAEEMFWDISQINAPQNNRLDEYDLFAGSSRIANPGIVDPADGGEIVQTLFSRCGVYSITCFSALRRLWCNLRRRRARFRWCTGVFFAGSWLCLDMGSIISFRFCFAHLLSCSFYNTTNFSFVSTHSPLLIDNNGTLSKLLKVDPLRVLFPHVEKMIRWVQI